MPELPEVETVKRGLQPAMQNRRIEFVELRRADLRFPFPQGFAERLQGRRISTLTRRAKYILAHLDSGDVLIMHLGMSGRFTVFAPEGSSQNLGEFYYLQGADTAGNGAHDHVVITLDDGAKLVYTDPRRFGMMDLCPEGDLDRHRLLASIGIEPLGNELNAAYLHDALKGRKTPLKAALLDQRIIAGLGNIYVCEALHRSGLSPKRLAGTLSRNRKVDERLERLSSAIRSILNEAIEAGGSTLRDYASTDGNSGAFQQLFSVYDREDEDCPKPDCSGTVQRIVQSGRSTFYCTSCQR
ncbi:MAG: bifunctional DNA-formamidopyrimidine glycosylase/DNA-(apurinic or apyrimidinic site) lyase [Rhizobiales bacterium]|nr:bifunctional DNA-formamidopyrimidine glycosylase/DNA-(apurinic or apyrimidinic site) lyase [Hyphomicrobiales bacterium]